MAKPPASIDAYLKSVAPDRRAALQRLRKTIHEILPGAEECISYSMPAFRHDGKAVAGFLATAKGCSYYPFSGTTLDTLDAQLKGYDRTKSALHFDAKRPLPKTLVRKLLEARLAETRTRAKAKAKPPAKTKGAPLDEILAPTALVFAREELEILQRIAEHPALGRAAVMRWQRRKMAGVPKRDLPAFREAVAGVDVAARVRAVVRQLEKAWACKLEPDTIASVREGVEAMYRGE